MATLFSSLINKHGQQKGESVPNFRAYASGSKEHKKA